MICPLYPRLRSVFVVASLFILGSVPSIAFNPYGFTWSSGNIAIRVNLDGATAPNLPPALFDGSTSWNQVARDSMTAWNSHLLRSQLVELPPADALTPADRNGQSDIIFADSVFGDAFGENTLGITLLEPDPANPARIIEADIVINNSRDWNSYRGARRTQLDLRRVLIHELGHLLGLGHPDDARPEQIVESIMNSSVSDTDQLTDDDTSGATALYGVTLTTPVITDAPTNIATTVGDLVTIDVEIGGSSVPLETNSSVTISWYYPDRLPQNFPDNYLFIEDRSRLDIGLVQTYDAGTYSLIASNADGLDQTDVELSVEPVPVSPVTQLANLSTRAFTGPGNRALTVGFVISGNQPHRVLLRAVGPTLGAAPYNLNATLSDPVLSLRKSNSDGTTSAVAVNDNWHQPEAGSVAEIRQVSETLGAFALNEGSGDAALLIELDPGVYTATVTGAGSTDAEGLVNVEAYDADPNGSENRLVNLSTRGFISNDDATMIAGLVVKGPAAKTYLIRVAGDTLADFGVSDPIDDPQMTLLRGSQRLRANDDWDHPPAHQNMLREIMAELGAFAFTDRQESAMLVTLAPGPYTVIVEGFDDGEGVGIVELYEVPTD
ncbi:matrixin family metalloprotease [Opitutaceae bacterium]|nr:matrixin family metalloprotease [Opitutaceae bacterium]